MASFFYKSFQYNSKSKKSLKKHKLNIDINKEAADQTKTKLNSFFFSSVAVHYSFFFCANL